MAEMGDAFPRRDLGGSAENWGRHLEQRIVVLESFIRQLSDGAANTSRQIEGNTANVSRQLSALQAQQEETRQVVTRLDSGVLARWSGTQNILKPTNALDFSAWWYSAGLETYIAPTNRCLMFCAVNSPFDTLIEYHVQGRMGLATGTGGSGSTSPTGAVWDTDSSTAASVWAFPKIPTNPNLQMGLVNTTPGVEYNLRVAVRSMAFDSVIPTTTPQITSISIYAMPV